MVARRVKYDWFYDSDNTIYGDDPAVNWELRGYAGNDKLFGNSGYDLLIGGSGNDRLWGGIGDDIHWGGSGDDLFYIDRGDNAYDGGWGDDRLDFSKVTTFNSGGWMSHEVDSFTVGFSVDVRSGDTRAQVLTLNGPSTAYSDFWGTNSFAHINDFSMTHQDDVLRDNDAGHTLNLRGGDDFVEGHGGADRIYGGTGTDTASYESSAIGVTVNLDWGEPSFDGDAAGDYLFGIENVRGSASDDHLFGSYENNKIEGGAGSDTIHGNSGEDIIEGGAGSDTIRGDSGTDILIGGAQADFFDFNSRFDSFLSLTNSDKIMDFACGSDRIMLDDIDANSATTANEIFNFIGQAGFTGAARELRVSVLEDSNGTLFNRVEADVNGDASADFRISVYAGGATLGAGDFFL